MMPRMRPAPGEGALIESLRKRTKRLSRRARSSGSLRLGIGDDCAILRPPRGQDVVVTTDFSIETVHFRREWHSPESAGHRCLARGLSDLAAMGAQPLAAFLSLAVPAELAGGRRGSSSWRDRFLDGFLRLAEKHGVPLAGGDTAQSPPCPCPGKTMPGLVNMPGLVLADVMLAGHAPRGRALPRSGARAGDRIYVTGSLGGAAAELMRLAERRGPGRSRKPESSGSNSHPHLFPEPRLGVGAWLLRHRRATAAIDISDGLSTDLDHLCRESGLAAVVEAESIPVHPLARPFGSASLSLGPKSGSRRNASNRPGLNLALHGGDDYELLFTAATDARIPPRIAGVPVACIGQTRGYRSGRPRVVLAEILNGRRQERRLPAAGWEHFHGSP